MVKSINEHRFHALIELFFADFAIIIHVDLFDDLQYHFVVFAFCHFEILLEFRLIYLAVSIYVEHVENSFNVWFVDQGRVVDGSLHKFLKTDVSVSIHVTHLHDPLNLLLLHIYLVSSFFNLELFICEKLIQRQILETFPQFIYCQ